MLPYFPFAQRFNDKVGTALLTETDALIEVDAQYRAEIALKRNLLTELPDYYYQALPGHETAQWDVLEVVLNSLEQTYPDSFSLRKTGNHWHWQNHLLNETLSFTFGDAAALPVSPLDWAGRQVQEDLLVLASNDGSSLQPSLVAGQLCFGNVWCLDEKMGLPFWEIHAPINGIVPPMMRAAQKIMERLPVGRPVWRLNWNIKITDQLDMTSRRMPELNQLLHDRLPHYTPETIGSQLFLRIERQTLTRLPRSGAILFGLHTYNNRLDAELAERHHAAQNLLNVLETAPPALLDYKTVSPFLPPLLAYLRGFLRS